MKFITQAAKVLNEQKKYKRRLAVFLCLAVVVALGTAAALKMYGQAMSHKQKKLVCRYAAHAHTDGCFDGEAVVCGYADYAVHLHNDDCYGPNGELVCHLPEAEAHVHTEECYTEQEVLICEEEGAQAHEHTEGCYTPERGELSCQMEEHMHEDSCYGENGEIICPLEEHQHDDNCYEWKDVLTCTLGGHTHTEDCYTREMRELSCTLEEHGHGEACYDEHGELVCQLEEHTHDDNCYVWEDVLTCQLEESDGGHVHGDGCYEIQKVLSCGKLELHTHDDSCCDENGALVCGLLQLEEHVHGKDCFETVELTEEEILALTGDEEETVSGDEASEEETVSGDEAEDKKTVSSNEAKKESHEHTEECYDAAGGLICGYNDKKTEITKICERDTYIVTATYTDEADIPDEAELIVDQITADSDTEHYTERENEFQKMVEDENASIEVLFKMGFYIKGKEIEPESTVNISIQLLDENGLKKGMPIKVVHFADHGSEIVNGSAAEDGNAIFEVSSFSEIAIGNVSGVTEIDESGTIYLSKTFKYDHESFHITFHLEGEAFPLEEDDNNASDTSNDLDMDHASEAEEDSEEHEENPPVELKDTLSVNDENVAESDIETVGMDNGINDAESENISLQTVGKPDGSVVSENTLSANIMENDIEQNLELEVVPLTEEFDAYQTIMDYTKGGNSGKTPALVEGVAYSLIYNDIKMDLSELEIKASVTPTQTFIENTNSTFSNDSDIFAMIVEISEGTVNELGMVLIEPESSDPETQELILTSNGEDGILAFAADDDLANPQFKVQYYANLDIVSKKDTGKLEVIDTRNRKDGSGGKLPENIAGGAAELVKIDLEGTGDRIEAGNGRINEMHRVKTDNKLTEVYSEESYYYADKPALTYFNNLVDNTNYQLSAIWILKEGKDKKSTNTNDWDIYEKNKDDSYTIEKQKVKVHFTNRKETADKYTEGEEKFILIKDTTVIRLVYNTTGSSETNATNFYDYDISDGKIYNNSKGEKTLDRNNTTFHESDPEWYLYTNKQGINSESNYADKGNGAKFAFGNKNTKTTLGEIMWNGNYPNKGNSYKIGEKTHYNAFKGCTFGLAKSLDSTGKIIYADQLAVPNLFNDGAASGKTEYEGSLTFNRKGDTYTMTAAEVAGNAISRLDLFNNPAQHSIWTNNFWPMDRVKSAGTHEHDLMFGSALSAGLNGKTLTFSGPGDGDKERVPLSDDYKNHNSYFGMHYTVDFTLTENYVGPLEYLFYGDDDMWVFLSKKTGENTYAPGTLICDIGGVHSSVGEYVDLWDWIEQGKEGKGEYRLSFFYTERGASGSSCWMQFTLPSVSFAQPERTTGALEISKEIAGGESDDEFEFNIRFNDPNGNWLKDDFAYTRYLADGSSEPKVLVWDNAQFFLKAGEHIEINYLPIGTTYTITEIGPVNKNTENHYLSSAAGQGVENTTSTEGNVAEGKPIATGTITEAGQNYSVAYTNTFYYELPETGGSGIILYTMAGALCIIFGTGFMYRKKLRERRVGGSS